MVETVRALVTFKASMLAATLWTAPFVAGLLLIAALAAQQGLNLDTTNTTSTTGTTSSAAAGQLHGARSPDVKVMPVAQTLQLHGVQQ